MITSGDFFESNATVLEHWIRGSRHIFEDLTQKDIRGTYSFIAENDSLTLEINGSKHKPLATIISEQSKRSSSLSYSKDWVQILFTTADTTDQRFLRFNAKITTDSSNLNGVLNSIDGSKQFLIIKKENKASEKYEKTDDKTKSKENRITVQPVTYPNGAYGNLKLPEAETLIFKNATVWTNETQGVLKNMDVLVKHGKISALSLIHISEPTRR